MTAQRMKGQRGKLRSAAQAALAALLLHTGVAKAVGPLVDDLSAEELTAAMAQLGSTDRMFGGGVVVAGGNGNGNFIGMNGQPFYASTPCSGTALSSGSVLTAAHCLAPSLHRKTVNGEIVNFGSGLGTGYTVAQGDGDRLVEKVVGAGGRISSRLGTGASAGGRVLAYITHNPYLGERDWALAAVGLSRGALAPAMAVLAGTPGIDTTPVPYKPPPGVTQAVPANTYLAYQVGASSHAAVLTQNWSLFDTRGGAVLAHPVGNLLLVEYAVARQIASTPLPNSAAGVPVPPYLYANELRLGGATNYAGDSGGGIFSFTASGQPVLRGLVSYVWHEGNEDTVALTGRHVGFVAPDYAPLQTARQTMGLYQGLTQADAGSVSWLPRFASEETRGVIGPQPPGPVVLAQVTGVFVLPGAYLDSLAWVAFNGQYDHHLTLSSGAFITGITFDENVRVSQLQFFDGGLGVKQPVAFIEAQGAPGFYVFDRPVQDLWLSGFDNHDSTGTLTLGLLLASQDGLDEGSAERRMATFADTAADGPADVTLHWSATRVLQAVPEPAGWALLLAGLGMLAWPRRASPLRPTSVTRANSWACTTMPTPARPTTPPTAAARPAAGPG
ncbi:hypothetical protein MW290_14020 [Aquincola tertiaricarbonis]|uniref:Peptidase S1 domain-containing protein n=1 Tax=Aquincola tertiaricarbonis TaxID=391953 RepID=A0ABY4S238_AQUTE|nr:hypothetical protein [Aquincola tertiaricarbonis]URI07003.1 hypothetical protein MW290_14020 [Aquincola tertiaricarbonis]